MDMKKNGTRGVRLFDGVDLVASGWLGWSLTAHHDCNAYLVAGRDDAVLVDAGCGRGVEATLAHVAAAGAPPVSRVLVTHAHADHAAASGAIAARLGAEVWASDAVATILEAGDADAAGLTGAKAAGIYPADLPYPATPVGRRLGDESLDVGGLRLDAIPSAGHALGHLSFLAHHRAGRILFSGDAIFARGRVVLADTPETDPAELAATIERLAALEPDALLSGHCEPVMRGALAHLLVARDAFRRGDRPPSLLG